QPAPAQARAPEQNHGFLEKLFGWFRKPAEPQPRMEIRQSFPQPTPALEDRGSREGRRDGGRGGRDRNRDGKRGDQQRGRGERGEQPQNQQQRGEGRRSEQRQERQGQQQPP